MFPFAHAHLECGPADGPAVRILLAGQPLSDDARAQPDPPYIEVLLNGSLSRITGRRLPVDPQGRGRIGTTHARYCDGRECVDLLSGVIRLSGLRDSILSGHYELRLPAGTNQKGKFRARWIEVPLYCG